MKRLIDRAEETVRHRIWPWFTMFAVGIGVGSNDVGTVLGAVILSIGVAMLEIETHSDDS